MWTPTSFYFVLYLDMPLDFSAAYNDIEMLIMFFRNLSWVNMVKEMQVMFAQCCFNLYIYMQETIGDAVDVLLKLSVLGVEKLFYVWLQSANDYGSIYLYQPLANGSKV